MFAVIKTGGRQYKVKADDLITVNRLPAETGDVIAFDNVLLFSDGSKTQIGAPRLADISVAGEVVEQTRGAKVIAFKKRRRKNSRRMRGHRQELSVVRITEILTGGKKPNLSAAKPAKSTQKSAEPSPALGEENMRRTARKTKARRKTSTKRKTTSRRKRKTRR